MKRINLFAPFVLCCFLLSPTSVFSQKGGPNQVNLERDFAAESTYDFQQSDLDSLIVWQEKVMLHLDKPTIAEGSPMFFKAYVLTGPRKVRAAVSKVLKLDLVNTDQEVVATQFHKIDNGTSVGAFMVPKKLEDGHYKLRAYTRWMQNYGEAFYFTKNLILDSKENELINDALEGEDLNVSFHAEGGNLLAGFENRLLIKAKTKSDRPVELSGEIVDNEGNVVMPIVAFEDGIMSVMFTPHKNQQYSLKTKDGATYELPEVVDEGYLLNVNNLNDDVLNIRVRASENVQDAPVIKGEMGGITYFIQSLDLNDAFVELEIPKKDIPFGILQISLLDSDGEKLAERPVFIDAANQLDLAITPLNDSKTDGELVFAVKVTDGNGEPVETDISFSAVNTTNDQEIHPKQKIDGFTWKQHGLYNSRRTNRFKTDLELLTNAELQDFNTKDLPVKIKYPFQEGLDLFGYAYDLNNKLLKNSKIQMLGSSDDDVVVKELQTDGSGRVRIENLQLVGANELIFRTSGEETKSRLVKLVPIQESYDEDHKPKSVLAYEKQKKRETMQTSPWEPIKNDDLVQLNEVIVSDSKVERKRAMPATYGLEAIKTKTMVQDVKKPKFLFQLLSELPGVMVSGSLEAPSVSLLSANNSILDQSGPLWVIDGFVVENFPGINPEWGLNFWDIDRIELLNRSDWAMYGSRAASGVIMIYTRNGLDTNFINRKEGRINFQGYYESPSFDTYAELLAKRPKKYTDKATTLFWNPSIKTNAQGEAIVRFTPPIDYDVIEIKASTITEDGRMASSRINFK